MEYVNGGEVSGYTLYLKPNFIVLLCYHPPTHPPLPPPKKKKKLIIDKLYKAKKYVFLAL